MSSLDIFVPFYLVGGRSLPHPPPPPQYFSFLDLVTKYFSKMTPCIRSKLIVGSRQISGYAYYRVACMQTSFVLSCAFHALWHFNHACMHKTPRNTHPEIGLDTGILSYFIPKVIFLKYFFTRGRKPKSVKKSCLGQTRLPITSKSKLIFEVGFLLLVNK